MDDEGIRAAFHEAVATLDPPVEHLVNGAMARGRRRALVMRAGAGLSVAAVLGGAAALVVALLPGRAAHRPSAIDVGGPSPGSVPAANSVPATKTARPPDTVTITAQALLQTALDTLPRAGTTSRYAGNFDDNGFVGVQFVFDDGDGAAQVDVAMQYPQPHATPHPPEPVVACRAAAEGCTVLPDGARANTSEGLEYPYQHDPNATERSVDLVRTDGVKVSISEWNAPQQKDAAISRAHPPFTLAELITWSDGPQWQVQITPQRADAAAGLFTPVDLREPPQNQPLTPKQQHRVELRNCRSARQTHKTPPSYCPGR
jgi:hypothetical protein